MRRGASQVGLAVLCVGCSNVLGADFEPESVETHRLSVTLPEHPGGSVGGPSSTGSGRVVSADERIDCGTKCQADYPVATKEVVLEALPDEGSAFAGWHSTSCSNERAPTCTVSLAESAAIEAYFVTNGANLWRFPVNAPAGPNVPNVGIAVRENGESYAFGAFEQKLILPGIELENEGKTDLFLLHLDADGALVPNDSGQASARTIGSTFSELASGLALSNSGPVVIANVTTGEQGTSAEIIPLSEVVIGQANGVIVGYDENLGVRWTAVTQGEGGHTFDFLAVDDDDRSYVLGTTSGTMSIGGKSTEALDEADVVLMRFAANGVPERVENLSGSNPIAVSTLRDSDEILVAAAPAATSGIFESCPPPKFADAQYVARINPLAGTCVDRLTFPPQFQLEQVRTTDDNHVLLIGRLHYGTIEFDPADENAQVDATDGPVHLVVLLDAHLQWVPEESWIQILTGNSKLNATGVGPELVLSWSANSDTLVGGNLVPYQVKHPMTFIALDLRGQMLWHRSFGAVDDSAATQIAWNEPSSTWFLATTIQTTQPLTLDLENVTQPPIPVDGRQTLFGRFAP